MKLAIPTEGNTKDAHVSDTFARCEFYCIYDSEAFTFTFIPNPFVEEELAGNKAAKYLMEQGVDYVIASDIGDKAQHTLQSFMIKTYACKKQESIVEQVYSFMEKDLDQLEEATKIRTHIN